MQRITALIIGAGQAGLAMSYCLSRKNIDHIVLERGHVANAWRTERWDSLRLLTPNWQSRLPGFDDEESNPDEFKTLSQTVRYFDAYARKIDAPVKTGTKVLNVSRIDNGYCVKTDQGDWLCRTLVLASGTMNTPSIPAFGKQLPSGTRSLSSREYRNPGEIEDGGVLVVGPSASGVQIAQELQLAGRDVTLSVGEHVRMPRTYRGRDIMWLMDQAGIFDTTIHEVDDLARVRRLPSMQLIGGPSRSTIGLNSLQSIGVDIVGRTMAMQDNRVQFSGSLSNVCHLADLKMNRLLRVLDDWAEFTGLSADLDPRYDLRPTCVPDAPDLSMDLQDRGIKTVIWASGFRPDYSWLDLPVLDRHGHLRHDGGVLELPGLYALGLAFMRKRKSGFIDGVGDDAHALSTHLATFLAGGVARAA
ncbi:NAD(P)-binding domain-containing protein [Hyphomonas sp.]|uniref:NAD(P)-binding domain-containing protein n=1 Tax=Hyphomonas sp. TaxID=87 RepID=UPI003D2D66BE